MTMSFFARGIALACLVAAVPQAAAETFTLTNGQVINGTVVRSLGNTVSIKYDNAGMLQVPILEIERVEIPTGDGGVVNGLFLGWSKGAYRLTTEQGQVEVSVEDGVAVAIVDGGDESRGGQGDVSTAALTQPVDGVAGGINAGFVYIGSPDDGGRMFMQERGRQALAENPGVGATAFVQLESEDGEQVTAAVDQLIGDKANLVFLTGNDSTDAVRESAKRHQDVRFVHCGPLDQAANIDIVCGRIYQARYLAGMIAGGMTETDLIGYVAARPTPNVIVGINAFALGVQSVNPNADVAVRWTNAWYAPGAAQKQAEVLVERGVDVLTIHQDSPAALQVAERHGIDAIGFQSDMSAFAPSSTLTSVVWNWGEIYNKAVDRLNDGNNSRRPTWLGLRDGAIGLAPLSSRVPDDLIRLVEQRQRQMIEGRFNVFTGPIRDIEGNERLPDGQIMIDEKLQTMDFLIEGVVGLSG